MRLFVGSLSFSVADQDLRQLFEPFGTIRSARVITDRDTGQSRGFGFVEFTSVDAAKQALSLDGSSFEGRRLAVKEAEERRAGGSSSAPRAPQQQSSSPNVIYKGRSNNGNGPSTSFPDQRPPAKKKGGSRKGGRNRRGYEDYDDWS